MAELTAFAPTLHAYAAAAATEAAPGLAARAPFRSHAERGPVSAPASVEGELPGWLLGDLVRTAPAVFDRVVGDRRFRADHWFDGLGLLYGFRIDRRGVAFRQALMQTEVEKASRGGDMPTASFGSPIVRSFWRRLFSPIPVVTDNTNVNVLALGQSRVALTESPHQWAFDPESLELTHRVSYQDRVGEVAMSAHAHFDFARQKVVNVATEIGPTNAVMVYEHGPDERTRTVIGKVKPGRLPYVHAFGLTPKHAVIIGHPFDVNPLAMLWSNKGFIDHFRYRPEQGTKLWLMDRGTGTVRTHLAPAGFVFHVVNAFEDGERTVLDVALYRDASIIDALRRPALEANGLPGLKTSIVRYTMTPNEEHAAVEVLLEDGFEFPSIAYRKKNGERHGVAWGTRVAAGGRSTVIRLDERGQTTFEREGLAFGEPIFVAKPGSSEEDEGVLLIVGGHESADRSELVVLDARTMAPLATATVPVPIPLGFHGTFFRAPA